MLAAGTGGENVVARLAEKLREHLASCVIALYNEKLFARGVQASVLIGKAKPQPGALS